MTGGKANYIPSVRTAARYVVTRNRVITLVELGTCVRSCRVCEQFRRADTRDALVDSLIECFSSLTSLEKEVADRYCTLK